jgi:hypothetical protein
LRKGSVFYRLRGKFPFGGGWDRQCPLERESVTTVWWSSAFCKHVQSHLTHNL